MRLATSTPVQTDSSTQTLRLEERRPRWSDPATTRSNSRAMSNMTRQLT